MGGELVVEQVRTVGAVNGEAEGEISQRVLATAAMFGLGVDAAREVRVVPRCWVPVRGGCVVFVTGPSGGGKSTMLGLLEKALRARGDVVISERDLPAARDVPVVDAVGDTVEEAMALLSLAGLGDAFVMLRRPRELSDGQRRRFELARMFERAERSAVKGDGGAARGAVVMVDEFCATLDRITAMGIARSARRWVNRTAHALVVATTHDDLLEPLQPDVLVWKGLGEEITVAERAR